MMKKLYIKIALVFLFFACSSYSFGQENVYAEFYEKSMVNNNTGMYVLGGWAVANMVIGGAGWYKNTGSSRYFNQMNVFWNTVNLSIAGFALYKNFTTGAENLTPELLMQNHLKTENLYLINAGLDVLYIGTGFFLNSRARKSINNYDLLKGYGNAVILQGSFLLIFDLVMWAVQQQHRLNFLTDLSLSMNKSEQFTTVALSFQF